jgi:sterol desaturase/sphingolipid hydroxylase (fatty acid hydroxylase superfamily)
VNAAVFTVALLLGAVGFAAAERLRPWRAGQRQRRPWLGSDLLFLGFNVFVVGVSLVALLRGVALPQLDRGFARLGVAPPLRGLAAGWPLGVQLLVAVLAMDLAQWSLHRLMHRVPFLWELHKVHHSVMDREMDWLVSLRFHWGEQLLYTVLHCLPLAYLGFTETAIRADSLLGLLWGYLNHANLDLGRGPWRYVFNSPRMHLWHHADAARPVNFGIVFSLWDWLFGTARLPEEPPERLGFPGVEAFPRGFWRGLSWPLRW